MEVSGLLLLLLLFGLGSLIESQAKTQRMLKTILTPAQLQAFEDAERQLRRRLLKRLGIILLVCTVGLAALVLAAIEASPGSPAWNTLHGPSRPPVTGTPVAPLPR